MAIGHGTSAQSSRDKTSIGARDKKGIGLASAPPGNNGLKYPRAGVLDVACSGQQHQVPSGRDVAEAGHYCYRWWGRKFVAVAPRELRETLRGVTVPSAQVGARCDFLGPLIEVDGRFGQSPGPQSVDEHPVLAGRSTGTVINANDFH